MAITRKSTNRAVLPIAVLLATSLLAELVRADDKARPDCGESSQGSGSCPVKNSVWSTLSGVLGGIVTVRGDEKRSRDTKTGKKGDAWSNDTVSEIAYYGKGYGFDKGGVPDVKTCSNLCTKYTAGNALNEASGMCAYWTYNSNSGGGFEGLQ